jgi:hypothetical protein
MKGQEETEAVSLTEAIQEAQCTPVDEMAVQW